MISILFKNSMYICAICLALGCGHKSNTQKLVEYVNDPKYKIFQSITIGNTIVESKFLPYDYRNITKKDSNNFLGDDFYFFDVRIKTKTMESLPKEKKMYLDFDMQKDFLLSYNRDSISASICQRIENGISGTYQYILAFKKNDYVKSPGFTLYYKDKIFGIGAVAFVYNSEEITKIPSLKS